MSVFIVFIYQTLLLITPKYGHRGERRHERVGKWSGSLQLRAPQLVSYIKYNHQFELRNSYDDHQNAQGSVRIKKQEVQVFNGDLLLAKRHRQRGRKEVGFFPKQRAQLMFVT